MKRSLLRMVIVISLIALLFGQLGLGVAYADYHVSRYIVTFEVVPNSAGELRDVRVKLEVTYDVRGESKLEGFKFVGTTQIEDVSVTDETGQPLEFQVKHMKEERIEWSFPTVTDGQRTVIARFIIPNALQGSKERNTFSAEWIKNWKVKVYNVTYRFIFPKDYKYQTITVSPSNYHEKVIDGRRAIEIGTDELSSTPFSIAFSPGLVEGKAPVKMSGAKQSSSFCSGPVVFLLFVLFFPGVLILNKLTTGKWTGSRKSSGSCSSCTSCSSCSSCSSCGGCGG